MDSVRRIEATAYRVLGEKSVWAFDREAWMRLVDPGGQPTELNAPPGPLEGVTGDACYFVCAASGIINPDPGIDVLRLDEDDAPHIINVDHYKVIERLSKHDAYLDICGQAGLADSPELRERLDELVFIVGPQRPDDHWCKDIPVRIQRAIRRPG